MKKVTLLLVFMSLLVLQAFSQREETLFGDRGIHLSGLWGTISHNFSSFENEEFQWIRGGNFGFEINCRRLYQIIAKTMKSKHCKIHLR